MEWTRHFEIINEFMMINAVIFDLDGVLIDSEPLHSKTDNQILRELGIRAAENYFDRFAGYTNESMWEAIKKDYHITKSTDKIIEMQMPLKLNLLQRKQESKPVLQLLNSSLAVTSN